MKKYIYNLRKWCGKEGAPNINNLINNKGFTIIGIFLAIVILIVLFDIFTCGACLGDGPLSCFTDCFCGSVDTFCQGFNSCYSCLYCG